MKYPDFKLEDGIEYILKNNGISSEYFLTMILDMANRIKALEEKE